MILFCDESIFRGLRYIVSIYTYMYNLECSNIN